MGAAEHRPAAGWTDATRPDARDEIENKITSTESSTGKLYVSEYFPQHRHVY
jgi:hypothetical protein